MVVAGLAHMWSQSSSEIYVMQLFFFSASALAEQTGEALLTTSTKQAARDIETSCDRIESPAQEPAIASPIPGVKACELSQRNTQRASSRTNRSDGGFIYGSDQSAQ
jgi:hypothetical protein